MQHYQTHPNLHHHGNAEQKANRMSMPNFPPQRPRPLGGSSSNQYHPGNRHSVDGSTINSGNYSQNQNYSGRPLQTSQNFRPQVFRPAVNEVNQRRYSQEYNRPVANSPAALLSVYAINGQFQAPRPRPPSKSSNYPGNPS